MSNPPTDPRPQDPSSEPDPLAKLYKMSATAGVATQDYVAVNPTAVVALLLGLASALAVVFGSLLLIVPIVALIVGIVAIVQVNRSGGTETGKGLAIIGILMAVLFAGARGGKELLYQRVINQEKDQIIALIDQLGKDVKSENYDHAWSLFSDRFQKTMSKQIFVGFWASTRADELYGQVVGMRWNGILEVSIDPETGARTAEGRIIIELKNGQSTRTTARFRKVADKWMFDGLQVFGG